MKTTDSYTEFADHVTCASLKREEAVPVVNRRQVQEYLYILFASLHGVPTCRSGQLNLVDGILSVSAIQIIQAQWKHFKSGTSRDLNENRVTAQKVSGVSPLENLCEM